MNLEMIVSTVAITAFALEKYLAYARLSEQLSTCGARAVVSNLDTSSSVGFRGAEWASYLDYSLLLWAFASCFS